MAEAVWNGSLRLSLVSCAIYLSSATSGAKRIRLARLSGRTGNPVTEQFVDAKTGDVVTGDALVKGYEFAESRYVTVTDDEIGKLGSGVGNIIDLEQFVPRHQIDHLYVDETFYIHPDGQLAADTVHALRVAMQRSGRAALGHVRIGDSERPALIEPYRGGLMMSTLRTADELVHADFVERAETEISGDMVEIAEAIIARRAAEFDASALRDRFQEDLRALVELTRSRVRHPRPLRNAGLASCRSRKRRRLLRHRLRRRDPRSSRRRRHPNRRRPRPGRLRRLPRPNLWSPRRRLHRRRYTPPAPEPPPPETVVVVVAPPPEPPEPRGGRRRHRRLSLWWSSSRPRRPSLRRRRLHRRSRLIVAPPPPPPPPPPPEPEPVLEPAVAGTHDVGAEILLHIMGLGDRRYVEAGLAAQSGAASARSRRLASARATRWRRARSSSVSSHRKGAPPPGSVMATTPAHAAATCR